MDNRDVATIFSRMADMLEIQGENPHRVLAYRRAAEAISTLGEPLSDMWQADALFSIPGVGKVLAAKIDELMRTGGLAAYDKLRAQVPEGVTDLLRVPGVGAKRAAVFWKQLGIESIDELEQAARQGRLAGLPGVGPKMEQRVLAGIAVLRRGAAQGDGLNSQPAEDL